MEVGQDEEVFTRNAFQEGPEGSAETLSEGEGGYWGYCESFEEVSRQRCLPEQTEWLIPAGEAGACC